MPLNVGGGAAGSVDVNRISAPGVSHGALPQHPPDSGHVLPILQPALSVATHGRQELRSEVIVPPGYGVVVDGHPHADHLAYGKRAVGQHILDRLLK